jgi:hypothetical protein
MNLGTPTGRRLAALILGCCAILLPGSAQAVPVGPATQAGSAGHAAQTRAARHAAARHVTARHATEPACETPGLVIWFNTSGDAAAGSVFYDLEFTNLSAHACTLNGFPFIHAVGLAGGNLGRRAGFTSATPHTITLGVGHTAKALLQIVDVANFPASQCKPVDAAGLRVYPPNQTRAKEVPFPFGGCSNGSGPVFLRVAPVTK